MVRLTGALVAALVCACGAGARVSAQSSATFPSSVARVDVAVGEDGRATVRETFQLHGIPAAVSFRAPAAACAPLDGVTAALDERQLPLASSGDAAWQTFQLTAPADASTVGPASRPSTLVVSYSTRLGARHSTLPLLVPAAALQRAPDSRGAIVALNVTFAADGRARVRLPRFAPTGRSGEWQTRLLALPSMLRIDLPAASTDRCDAFQAGPTGGLVWRALTFVGTMGLWIPVYFWWFGRRQAEV